MGKVHGAGKRMTFLLMDDSTGTVEDLCKLAGLYSLSNGLIQY